MNTYTASTEVDGIIEELIENDTDHYHLKESGVTVSVLFFSGDGPLKHAGYPAAATIRKTNPKERALGQSDAIITIDRGAWANFDAAERMALIDHELMHLEPVIDAWTYMTDPKTGELVLRDGEVVRESCTYKYDEHHRPKLRMRLHDVQHGWFIRNAEKWGKASGEKRQAELLADRYGQLLFGLMATENEKQLNIRREERRSSNLPDGLGVTVGNPETATLSLG